MGNQQTKVVSTQTRNNFLLDGILLLGGVLSAISGIYFLFLPVGGYQGGKNALYGIRILFERHTWDDIHAWASVVMIAIAAVHIPLHWSWIVSMTRRGFKSFTGKKKLNMYSQFNLAVNVLIGISGLIAALSGLYFLLVPGASRSSGLPDPAWVFHRLTWDVIHTWSGVVMIAAAVLHFWIHWKWFYKIAWKYWLALGTNRSKRGIVSSPPAVAESIGD